MNTINNVKIYVIIKKNTHKATNGKGWLTLNYD